MSDPGSSYLPLDQFSFSGDTSGGGAVSDPFGSATIPASTMPVDTSSGGFSFGDTFNSLTADATQLLPLVAEYRSVFGQKVSPYPLPGFSPGSYNAYNAATPPPPGSYGSMQQSPLSTFDWSQLVNPNSSYPWLIGSGLLALFVLKSLASPPRGRR